MSAVVSREVSDAAFQAARDKINASGYGHLVNDENVRELTDIVATAVLKAALRESKTKPADPDQPLAPPQE